jgi:hypothetical protein
MNTRRLLIIREVVDSKPGTPPKRHGLGCSNASLDGDYDPTDYLPRLGFMVHASHLFHLGDVFRQSSCNDPPQISSSDKQCSCWNFPGAWVDAESGI